VENMIKEIPNLKISKSCEKTLYKCLDESEMPGMYFTLDEIGKRIKTSPPKLEKIILKLKQNGFVSSVTSFNPTGFRTNANINEIIKIF
jgi:tRNA (guanine26-N2/guanine27-N2)-dimethyltransferase